MSPLLGIKKDRGFFFLNEEREREGKREKECVRACVCACVRASEGVCACVRAHARTRATLLYAGNRHLDAFWALFSSSSLFVY